MKKLILTQFIVLIIGTLFAWTNFTNELIKWINRQSCTLGCTLGSANPFLTPCFYGAIFFTISLVLSILILKSFYKKS